MCKTLSAWAVECRFPLGSSISRKQGMASAYTMYARSLSWVHHLVNGVERSSQYCASKGPLTTGKKYQAQRHSLLWTTLIMSPNSTAMVCSCLFPDSFPCTWFFPWLVRVYQLHLTPPQAFQGQDKPALLFCAVAGSISSSSALLVFGLWILYGM